MGFRKEQQPVISKRGGREGGIRTSTAASTELDPRGLIGLLTTSTATGTPVVYTLSRLPKRGDEFFIFADNLASSSEGPFHVQAASLSFFGSSSEGMLSLARKGAGAHVIGYSSARWAVVGLSQQDSSGNLFPST